MNKPITWVKAQCPVCGREYEYPKSGHKPSTCSNFDCIYKYVHNPAKYKSFQEHLDMCRKEAGI